MHRRDTYILKYPASTSSYEPTLKLIKRKIQSDIILYADEGSLGWPGPTIVGTWYAKNAIFRLGSRRSSRQKYVIARRGLLFGEDVWHYLIFFSLKPFMGYKGRKKGYFEKEVFQLRKNQRKYSIHSVCFCQICVGAIKTNSTIH